MNDFVFDGSPGLGYGAVHTNCCKEHKMNDFVFDGSPGVGYGAVHTNCCKEHKMNETWKNLELYSPEEFEHAKKVSESIWQSGMVKRPWLHNPLSVLFVMQRGRDLGIPVAAALEGLFQFPQGGWGISINLAKALILRSGGQVRVTEESDELCVIEMVRPEWRERSTHTERVTRADLDRAGISNKDTYRKFPRQIIRANAFRRAATLIFADKLLGLVPLDMEVEERSLPNDNGAENVASDNTVVAAEVTEEQHKPKRGWPAGKPRKVKDSSETTTVSEHEGIKEESEVVTESPKVVTQELPAEPPAPQADFDEFLAGKVVPMTKPVAEEQVERPIAADPAGEVYDPKNINHTRVKVVITSRCLKEPGDSDVLRNNWDKYTKSCTVLATPESLESHITRCIAMNRGK